MGNRQIVKQTTKKQTKVFLQELVDALKLTSCPYPELSCSLLQTWEKSVFLNFNNCTSALALFAHRGHIGSLYLCISRFLAILGDLTLPWEGMQEGDRIPFFACDISISHCRGNLLSNSSSPPITVLPKRACTQYKAKFPQGSLL